MTHVCLIAEGSYPYVTGGVGKWTHDLIAALPEVDFTVVALWPSPESAGTPRYPRLPNVREFQHVYLMKGEMGAAPLHARDVERLEAFHHGILQGEPPPLDGVLDGLNGGSFMSDAKAWDMVCRLYEKYAPRDISFPDYFWTWRATMAPLLRTLEARLPKSAAIHCISTGYAGLLGAAHRRRTGCPLITTEHGLYTRERAQELWDTDWIPGESYARSRRSVNYFKDVWNRMFLSMEKAAYSSSEAVVALFEENRRYQISHGAPEARTHVIPNGIDLAVFDPVRARRRPRGSAQRGSREPFRIGLVGRVVPIKDIKTFISACKILAMSFDPAQLKIYVIGPSEEDDEYAEECRDMVRLLGLSDLITFTGKVDSRKYYEILDVVVLTSLSEGQPLTLLECLSCAIPAVATDVGACRELLEGGSAEDRALGAAGFITLPADPEGTARAMLDLARNRDLCRTMGEAGRKRVETYYRMDQMRDAYLNLYRSTANGRS